MPGGRLGAAILVLALVLRVGFVLGTPDYRPVHDDRDFDRMACAIVNTGDFPLAPASEPTPRSCAQVGLDGGHLAVAYRPPGLPYLLAGTYIATSWLTDDRITAGRLLIAVCGAALVLLLGMVASRIWGRRVALVAMGIAAVFPPLIIVGGSLLSEVPFTALVLGATLLVLIHRDRCPEQVFSRWLAGAAAVAGLSWLMRGNGIIVIALLAAALVARPGARLHSVGSAAAFVAVALAVVAPWTVRNAIELHAFVPIYMSNAALAGNFNPEAFADPVRPAAWRMPTQTPSLAPMVRRFGDDRAGLDAAFADSAFGYVKAHPEAIPIAIRWNTQRLFMLGGGGPTWDRFSLNVAGQPGRYAAITKVSMWLLAVLGVIGLLTAATWRAPWWFWLIPMSAFLVAALLCSEIRYAVPFMPYMALLGALGVVGLRDRSGRAA